MHFRTSSKERLFFALFVSGQTIYNTMLNSFGQKFMTEAGLSAAAVGAIFLSVRVFDSTNDPFFGGLIDRSRFKGGRFLPWLKISTVLLPILISICFFMPSTLPYSSMVMYALIISVITSVAYTICDVPIFSMVSAVSDNVQERVHIQSRNSISGAIATIGAVVAVPALYPVIGWGWTGVIMSIAAFVLMAGASVFRRF
jgi:Na+/melibiose symporter-like transporter